MPAQIGRRGEPVHGLLDPATRAGVLSRYGGDWLSCLPKIVSAEVARLSLEVVRLLPGGRTACVLAVKRGQGNLVLKLTPDTERSAREAAAMLRLAQAAIGPTLLEVWTDQYAEVPYHAMLLQMVGDGTSIRDKPQNCPPALVLANFLSVLGEIGNITLDAALDPVSVHVRKSMERGTGGGSRGTSRPSRTELETASLELDELETASTDHWVHGTLHPGNLVLDMGGRLYGIDPRPFLADRQYDIAELALKVGSERAGRNHNINDGLRLLDELASEMSFDQVRAERWLRVIAASGV